MSDFTRDIWEKNKKVIFGKMTETNGEMHHVFGRNGVYLCCPLLLVFGKKGHDLDGAWKAEQRDVHKNLKTYVDMNYVHNMGCRKCIAVGCHVCNMPKIEEEKNTPENHDKATLPRVAGCAYDEKFKKL